MRRAVPALLLATALLLPACTGGDDGAATATPVVEPADTIPTPTASPATTNPASPTTQPAATPTAPPAVLAIAAGWEQVTVTGAEPGEAIDLVERDRGTVADGVADANGALLFRRLEPGIVHAVSARGVSPEAKVMPRDAMTDSMLDGSFYGEQRLTADGPTGTLNYITTRDGTTLSASVWLPGPAENGPYPTVVEYSGYQPSDPASQGFPQMFNALGYAYVGVNMRGTGCSGGSYRFFEYVQSLDGYDAIETVAAQPWVQGHRVGMVGISYPGISQLFVAQTRPPSLAAITPLSVLADSYQSTLYPGGILNTGFAVEWTEARQEEARPAGQAWAAARIAGDGQGADSTCAANQLLRLQNPDLTAEIEANPFWTDELGTELAPETFVDRIDVPVFLAGAWQDEQTGGHFATMLDRFTGTDHFYATLLNGLHTEAIGPAVLPRLVEFLDLYVAARVPSLAAARGVAPILAESLVGTTAVALPADDRFAGLTYEQALAAFEAEPPIQVLFEEGAAEGFPERAPMARFGAGFDAWPVPQATPRRWYLSSNGVRGFEGSLDDAPGARPGSTSDYLALPDAVPATFYEGPGDGIWSADVTYDWEQGGYGTYAAFLSSPLAEDTAVVGTGSVDLWIESNHVDGASAGDTDLEVTVSEVFADQFGPKEVYVQSGWLRASHRALDADESTELRPVHTDLAADAAPLPEGAPELVRVELFPFAHVFRAGSRIRLTVDAPGGNRGVWEFDTIAGGEQVTITHDAAHASSVVLPVVDLAALGVDVPDSYPACGALRGQPCRAYLP